MIRAHNRTAQLLSLLLLAVVYLTVLIMQGFSTLERSLDQYVGSEVESSMLQGSPGKSASELPAPFTSRHYPKASGRSPAERVSPARDRINHAAIVSSLQPGNWRLRGHPAIQNARALQVVRHLAGNPGAVPAPMAALSNPHHLSGGLPAAYQNVVVTLRRVRHSTLLGGIVTLLLMAGVLGNGFLELSGGRRREGDLRTGDEQDGEIRRGAYMEQRGYDHGEGDLGGLLQEQALRFRKQEEVYGELLRSLETLKHDLRGPLSLVRLHMSMLENRNLPECKQKKAVAAVNRAVDKAVSLLEECGCPVVQPEERSGGVTCQGLDLGLLLQDVTDDWQEVAGDKGQSLESILEPGPLMVGGNPTRVGQMVENLVGNAVRHAPRGAHITIRAEKRDNQLVFCVEDDGPVIPEALRARVFERNFSTAKGVTVPPGGGVCDRGAEPSWQVVGKGLGLSICQEIIADMGGHIWLECGKERGNRFCTSLNLVDPVRPL